MVDTTPPLTGRAAIVTGAAGDLGRVIVARLAAAGAHVIGTDFRADYGAANDRTAALLAHDVTSEVDWERVVAETLARHGRLDILVNCAGITPVCLLENQSIAEWDRVMAVNARGPMIGMRTALPALRAAARDRPAGAAIVNIASAQGYVAGQPGLCAYAASKAALRLMTRTAAVEFGRLGYNVRCNAVVPSAIGGSALMNHQVGLQVERGVFESIEQGVRTITATFPLGRTATPADIAEATLFLASDAAASITGIDLPVDGGRCA